MKLLLSIATGLLLVSTAVSAADIEAGKAKSAACAACHGGTGISPTPIWPNLAGQKSNIC